MELPVNPISENFQSAPGRAPFLLFSLTVKGEKWRRDLVNPIAHVWLVLVLEREKKSAPI